MKHTPGPWIAESNFVYALNEQQVNRFSLSLCQGYSNIGRTSTEELVANARLIATAPDLLKEMEAVHRILRKQGHDMTSIDAAITQAKGE